MLGKCEVCSGTGRIERPNDIQNLQSSQPELSVENYEFSEDQVRSRVEKGRAGNYVLGYSALHSDTNIRVFHPTFVGRSDSDLREALLTRLAKKKAWHDQFKFSYAATVKEAFEKECQEFHLAASAKDLDNEKHPEPPAGTNFRCPIPDCSALNHRYDTGETST